MVEKSELFFAHLPIRKALLRLVQILQLILLLN